MAGGVNGGVLAVGVGRGEEQGWRRSRRRVENRRGGRDEVNCREWQSGKEVLARGGMDEECLLRGRNKTMPFLERCCRRRRRLWPVLLLVPKQLLRKEKKAEWLLETVYLYVHGHVYMYRRACVRVCVEIVYMCM